MPKQDQPDIDLTRLKGCAVEVVGDQLMAHQSLSISHKGGMTVMQASPNLPSGQDMKLTVEIPDNLASSELLVRAAAHDVSGVAYYPKGSPLTGTPSGYKEGNTASPAADDLAARARTTLRNIGTCARKP